MKPLPLPLRVAAGLAVTAAERARELPKNLVGLPVTVASQVLQFSMRVQQHVTELAIKGDEALSSLQSVEETPSWATFDEDLPPVDDTSSGNNGYRPATVLRDVSESARDPWEQEERALAEDHLEGEFDSENGPENGPSSGGVNGTEPDAGATARRGGRADLRSVGGTGSGGYVGPGGDVESGGDVEFRGDVESAGAVQSGGDVESGGDIESGRDVETGADVEFRGTRSGGDAESTRPGSGGDVEVGGATARGDVEVTGTESGGDVETGPTSATEPSAERGTESTTPGTEAEGLGAAGPEGIGIEPEAIIGSAGLANYDELTLPQLRARLRRFTLEQLDQLLAYERTHENRPSFVGMLSRRIGNVQRLSEGDNGMDTPGR